MSNNKEIINKLFKVVAQQQQIITKLAQQAGAGAPPTTDVKATVEAEILDVLFGRGAKIPTGGTRPQVLYAKIVPGANNEKTLVSGVTIPDEFTSKWQMAQNLIVAALKNKLGVTSVNFKL